MKQGMNAVQVISVAAIVSTSITATVGLLSFAALQLISSEKNFNFDGAVTSKEINLKVTVEKEYPKIAGRSKKNDAVLSLPTKSKRISEKSSELQHTDP